MKEIEENKGGCLCNLRVKKAFLSIKSNMY